MAAISKEKKVGRKQANLFSFQGQEMDTLRKAPKLQQFFAIQTLI